MNNFFTRIREIETFYNYNFNKTAWLWILLRAVTLSSYSCCKWFFTMCKALRRCQEYLLPSQVVSIYRINHFFIWFQFFLKRNNMSFCLSYSSSVVESHHDQGKAFSWGLMFSKGRKVHDHHGRQHAAGRGWCWRVTESSHLTHKYKAERTKLNGLGFSNLKTQTQWQTPLNKAIPPTLSQTVWRPNFETQEHVGTILIQTISYFLPVWIYRYSLWAECW